MSAIKKEERFKVQNLICPDRHFPHQVVSDPLVVILLVVVHPDLGQPDGVPLEDVDTGPPAVRRPFPEDVAHVRARDDLQSAVTHPSLEIAIQFLRSTLNCT